MQHRTQRADGLISCLPWDRRAALDIPPAFNKCFYPDSLRPTGGQVLAFFPPAARTKKIRRTTACEKARSTIAVYFRAAPKELSKEFRSATVKVRGSARCTRKNDEGEGERGGEDRGAPPPSSMRFSLPAARTLYGFRPRFMRQEHDIWVF